MKTSAHQKNLTSAFDIDRELQFDILIQIDGVAANVSEGLLGCCYAVN